MIRIGHLSDIHVPAMEAMRPRDFLTKRLTGWLNFKLHRQHEYQITVLDHAIARLIDAAVDIVIVSGDLSNLAFREEFERAHQHLSALDRAGIPWRVIPGNHDRYLASAVDGSFERIFAQNLGRPLSDNTPWPWIEELEGATIIGINSALPTPPFSAWGEVGEAQLQTLRDAKTRIQERGRPLVLAVHHHLGKAPNKKRDENRNLRDHIDLTLLAHGLGASLVVHGHNHYLDVRNYGSVRVFAASSGISSQQGFHRTAGQVAIHELDGQTVTHRVAFWEGEAFSDWRVITPETDVPASAKKAKKAKKSQRALPV